nr:hypothetical protein GCM10010200_110880 [Actinomadura rugatobispora]
MRAGERHGSDALIRALRDQGVDDPRVLDAFRRTPREGFVPASHRAEAYEDIPLPIPHGQVTSQPSLIAQMVAALGLTGRERVLEIGTGLGFQTALLGRLAREVWSVERYADLAARSRANLAAAGVPNATVIVGDGTRGLAGHAPYDGVVVSAAAPEVPAPLAGQLAAGGTPGPAHRHRRRRAGHRFHRAGRTAAERGTGDVRAFRSPGRKARALRMTGNSII